MDTQQIIILLALVPIFLLMFLPQWLERRRQRKQMDALSVGNEIMTAGGIIATITHIDEDENRATIEIAPGVKINVILPAINRVLTPPAEQEEDTRPDNES